MFDENSKLERNSDIICQKIPPYFLAKVYLRTKKTNRCDQKAAKQFLET